MKNALKIQKQKQAMQRSAAEKKPAVPKGPKWILLSVVAVGTALATFALFEYVLLSRVPAAMLGKWVVDSQDADPQDVGTIEFFRDGSVTGKFMGREEPGTARVEGDRVNITIFDRRTWSETTTSYLLISLTHDHMELEREPSFAKDGAMRGGVLRMKRPTASAGKA